MIKHLTLLLFIGLVWGQFNGSVELKSGIVYTGEITEVNESFVFLLSNGKDSPQGIPIKIIANSFLDDDVIIIKNGELVNTIQDNQLIKTEVLDIVDAAVIDSVDTTIVEIDPQLERLNSIDKYLKSIDKNVKVITNCFRAQFGCFLIYIILTIISN